MIRPCKDAWAVARTFSLILKGNSFFLLLSVFECYSVLRQLRHLLFLRLFGDVLILF